MNCTRCQGTGFLNIEQVPDEIKPLAAYRIVEWISANDTDARICDCCGDGEGWYGEPGNHYTSDDPPGHYGPYAYNGGLCECN